MNEKTRKYADYPGQEATGKFIRDLRLAHNLTQQQLSDEVYVTRKAVSKWENGDCYPSIDTLLLLADYFGVTLDDLLFAEFVNDDDTDSEVSMNFVQKIFRNQKVKIITRFIIAFVALILVIFFFENYNATKIYNVYYDDGEIYLYNSTLMITRGREYFNIGYAYLDFYDIPNNADIEYILYLKDKDDITELLNYKMNNTTLYFQNSDYNELTYKNIENNLDKLYMKLKYINIQGEEKEFDIHLSVDLSYQSNDFYNFKKDNKEIVNDSNLKANSTVSVSKFNDNYVINLDRLYNTDLNKIKSKYDNKVYKIKDYKTEFKIRGTMFVIESANFVIIFDIDNNMMYFGNNLHLDKRAISENHNIYLNDGDKELYEIITTVLTILEK